MQLLKGKEGVELAPRCTALLPTREFGFNKFEISVEMSCFYYYHCEC